MSFSWPIALLGLALVPLALLGYVLVQRRRQQYAVRFTNLDLLASVVDRAPRWRRHVPPALALLALTALVLAVAQPTIAREVPQEKATVILTMDVSGSMQATDVQPDRMAAAKEAANAFLDQVPDTVSVGVVSFSTGAQVVLSPTTDHDAVRQAVDALEPGGGTALGDAIADSASLAKSLGGDASTGAAQPASTLPADTKGDAPAVVVLLSDGANSSGSLEPAQAADRAAADGVPVYTVALGTDQGSVTIDPGDGTGPQTIPVPPDPETLARVAEQTGGRFFDAPDASDLKSIYERVGAEVGTETQQDDIGFAFAAAGAVLLVAGGALSALWFGRIP
jgi:Ca-activated chloride channel family protein